jgi:Homeodomain-like domain
LSTKVYGSDLFAYDFEGALGSASKRATPEQIGKSFGWACGKLAGDYARAFWFNRRRSERQAVQPQPPTRDELVRHVKRYGPEGVEEVARAHGIDLAEKVRPRTAAEKRRANALLMIEDGKSPEDVARNESVSVETVRRWQRESEAMPKGVQQVRGRGQKRRSTMRPKVQR